MPKDVVMPVLGMTQDHGVLVRWLQRAGDRVAAGSPLMEIETDKAVVEVEAPADGILGDVLLAEGEEAAVGTVIARIYGADESIPARRPVAAAPAPPATAATLGDRTATTHGTPTPANRADGRALASPKAKRLARERGVDLARLQGSGPGGAVLADDVPAHAAATPTPPGHAGVLEIEPDAREVLRLIARHPGRVGGPDLVVMMVVAAIREQAAWGRDATIELVEHGAGGAARRGTFRAADLRRLDDVAALRSRLPAAGSVGATSNTIDLRLHDLMASPVSKRIEARGPVTIEVGRLVERPVVDEGRVEARPHLPLTLTFDPEHVREEAAVALLTELAQLVVDPSLLVLRRRD